MSYLSYLMFIKSNTIILIIQSTSSAATKQADDTITHTEL